MAIKGQFKSHLKLDSDDLNCGKSFDYKKLIKEQIIWFLFLGPGKYNKSDF